MRLEFRKWFEAVKSREDRSVTVIHKPSLQDVQNIFRQKALRQDVPDWEREIVFGTGERSDEPEYSRDDVADRQVYDYMRQLEKGERARPSSKDWRELKRQFMQAAMRRGDLHWAQSIIDDIESGPSQKSDEDDDETTNVLYSRELRKPPPNPKASTVGLTGDLTSPHI